MTNQKINEFMIAEETGKSWSKWEDILGYFNAKKKNHKINVQNLRDKYSLTPWWSEFLIARYEKGKY